MNFIINLCLIILVRIIDVSLGTIRTVLVIREKKTIGAFIGFVEVLVWFLIVRRALTTDEGSFWIAIAYAGGFAIGTYTGAWLEEKMAIGNASIQIITKGIRYDLVKILRNNGFAVSTMSVQGKDTDNLMLIIEVNRKRIKIAKEIIKKHAPDSFVIISDIKQTLGGYFDNDVRR